MINIEAILWYALLLDSLIANIVSFCCSKWYKKNYKKFYRYFPITKGWSSLYLILVLWVGYTLLRLNILPW